MGRRFRGFSADRSTGIDLVDCRMYGGNPGWEDGKKGVAALAEGGGVAKLWFRNGRIRWGRWEMGWLGGVKKRKDGDDG